MKYGTILCTLIRYKSLAYCGGSRLLKIYASESCRCTLNSQSSSKLLEDFYKKTSCRYFSNDTNGKYIVERDLHRNRFCINVKDVGSAHLEYECQNQLIKLIHTEVPPSLGGRGLGKLLAKKALEYVAENDLQLEIHCEFVREYVNKYAPKYIKYLKDD